jgi:very-short-patch-repair endonuclease
MYHLYNDKALRPLRKNLRNDSTDAERQLWKILRGKQLQGLKFRRQYGVGNYILDFYCPKIRLAIELDGGQHMDKREVDDARTAYLNSQDISVLRFWNNDISKNLEGVFQTINEAVIRLSK